MGLLAGAIVTLAKGALTSAIGPFIAEARESTVNAATDCVKAAIAGRIPVDDWANNVITSIDELKERIASESDLRYVGGKLKFKHSQNASESVNISFQLYFLDENGKWQLAEAATDVQNTLFTFEDLDKMYSDGEISYDVE